MSTPRPSMKLLVESGIVPRAPNQRPLTNIGQNQSPFPNRVSASSPFAKDAMTDPELLIVSYCTLEECSPTWGVRYSCQNFGGGAAPRRVEEAIKNNFTPGVRGGSEGVAAICSRWRESAEVFSSAKHTSSPPPLLIRSGRSTIYKANILETKDLKQRLSLIRPRCSHLNAAPGA
ncbi:unnamed protein product [Nezara viridula]|uniref:Uncharacterized protein n=1 Tax=Nezara viridula TaxID=85310 RepID=A0A9P0MUP0_NEZVI|nr:unnamed protein product [Nezara viridula]